MIKNISIIAISVFVLSSCSTSKATSSATPEKKTISANTTKTTEKKPVVIKSKTGIKAINALSAEDSKKAVKINTTLSQKKVK